MKKIIGNPLQIAISIGNERYKIQSLSIEHYKEVQEQTLLEILRQNSGTEYGCLHNFSGISSSKEYAEKVPLSTYRVYRPYVKRIVQEHSRNLLCAEPLTGFATTSATSGNKKYIPQNRSLNMAFIQDYALRALAMANRNYAEKHGKQMDHGFVLILLGSAVQYAEGDGDEKLPVSAIGGMSILQVAENMQLAALPPVQLLGEQASHIENTEYLYLRLALACREIVYAVSIYDDYVVNILRYLNQNWRQLCDEIEKGESAFSSEVLAHADSKEFEKFRAFLQPDPARAAELREILADGVKEDTLHRIWPELMIFSAATKKGQFLGNSGLKKYLKGIGHDCSPYGATEGLFGVGVQPGDDRIQVLPHHIFYEFIPEEQIEEENPDIFTLDQLEDDRLYEIVITTRAGLYRYRIGDLLRVTGRIGDFPLFTFEGRKGVGIDLVSEKSPESALRDALTVAAVRCKVPIAACCMYGEDKRFQNDAFLSETAKSSSRYVVQFESKKELNSFEMGAFANEIDRQICSVIKSYAAARKSVGLLPLRVEQVPFGSFLAYEDEMRKKAANPAQYKRNFIMKLEKMLLTDG